MRCDFCWRPATATLLGRRVGWLRKRLGFSRKQVRACPSHFGAAADRLRGWL